MQRQTRSEVEAALRAIEADETPPTNQPLYIDGGFAEFGCSIETQAHARECVRHPDAIQAYEYEGNATFVATRLIDTGRTSFVQITQGLLRDGTFRVRSCHRLYGAVDPASLARNPSAALAAFLEELGWPFQPFDRPALFLPFFEKPWQGPDLTLEWMLATLGLSGPEGKELLVNCPSSSQKTIAP